MGISSTIGSSLITAAPFTGPAAPFVALGGFVASGFGLIPPRGNFQKFERVAYPTLLAQSQANGIPVAVQWFNGDIVLVTPNGQYGIYANIQNNPDKYAWIEALRKETSFLKAECSRSDNDCANHAGDYYYDLYEKTTPIGENFQKVKNFILSIEPFYWILIAILIVGLIVL